MFSLKSCKSETRLCEDLVFWNAQRSLYLTDMRKPKLAAEIAKQLREFHRVEVPGSKEPQLWNDIFKFLKQGQSLTSNFPA